MGGGTHRLARGRAPFAVVLAAAGLFAFVPRPAHANPSMRTIAAVAGGLIGWAAADPAVTTPDGGSNLFAAGAFDRVDRVAQTSDVEFQHRWGGFLLWRAKPFVGAGVTGRRSVYAFAGLVLGVHATRHLVISPSLAVAAYYRGGGKDLGSPVDFRSGVDVQWRFRGGARLGIAYHHISHWFLFGAFNPGTEVLDLTFSYPLGR